MKESSATVPERDRDELPRYGRTDGLATPHLPDVIREQDETGTASFREVIANRPFRSLWIAQILSQLAQNLTWITLGAYVAGETGSNTLVSATIISGSLAQLLFSGFAGVLVDRTSKRAVLVSSNAIRVGLALLFIAATRLDIGIKTTAIIVLIFVANAVAQFFTPAESATIPLLVEKRNLIAASSLFNITLNACQVVPIVLGLVILALVGIVPVLLLVAAFYVGAALLVSLLPAETAVARAAPMAGSLREAAGHVVGDVREALRFLARDPGLRLTLFQINVAPTFLFVFGTLGLTFVQQTFGLRADHAWILLLPAGVGLVLGAVSMGRFASRARKEDLINLGLLVMGVAIAALGAVAVIVNAFSRAAGGVSGFLSKHVHRLPQGPHFGHVPLGYVPPAMVVALVIGLGMSLSTIPAQTLVLERTAEEVRGRVLSMQQLVGGATPIIPLLVVAPLADLFGTTAVMTGLGVVIVLLGVLGVRLDRAMRRAT